MTVACLNIPQYFELQFFFGGGVGWGWCDCTVDRHKHCGGTIHSG